VFDSVVCLDNLTFFAILLMTHQNNVFFLPLVLLKLALKCYGVVTTNTGA